MVEILPTYVPQNLPDLIAKIAFTRSFAEVAHVDIDDGILAPVLSWPYTEKGEFSEFDLTGTEGIVRETHLMVEGPRQIGVAFAKAGAERIIGHVEGFNDATEAHGALDAWRQAGAKEVGLSILTGTPIPVLEPLIPACDIVQVMSVASIGLQGAPFYEGAIARIAELHEKYAKLLISVDGGVSLSNIGALAAAGAKRFCVGSALSKAADPAAMYKQLMDLAEAAP